MSVKPIATVRVKPAEHRAFAKLSGDRNPIHVDAAYARRSFAGEPIVHGAHLLLRAIDAHCRSARIAGPLSVTARFLKPAFPGEPIEIFRTAEDAAVRLTISAGATLADVLIAPRPAGDAPTPPHGTDLTPARASRPPREPAVRGVEDADRAKGVLEPADAAAASRAFPRAARALGAEVVAAIARLSAVVGMECPGRDSLLSQMTLDVTPRAPESPLDWRVTRTDRLLRLVRLAVRGAGVVGTVQAFVRRPPAPAPDVAAIASIVTPGEFAGQTALIVGGSRGLGAATAAIVAAGGGAAILTYHSSGEAAASLKRAIVAAGFKADALRIDVVEHSGPLAKAAERFGVTHLYYFATPKIFARRREPFDVALFHRFCEVYVDGFARACDAVASAAPAASVFYPSSTAIAEFLPDLTEYSAAKAAGETLCDVLPRILSGLSIMRMRLPRITTDQTASLIAAAAADPVEVMLPIVRELHQSRAAMTEAGRA